MSQNSNEELVDQTEKDGSDDPKFSGRLRGSRLINKGAELLLALPGGERNVALLRQAACESLNVMHYGRMDMPLIVGIETISRCNRARKYCTISHPDFRTAHPEPRMSEALFTKIVTELGRFPRTKGRKGFCGTVHLNGYGEPLLDKSIYAKVVETRQALPDARIGFFSNGDYLTEDRYLQLRESGIDELLVTPHDGQHPQALVDLAKKYAQDHIINLRPPLAYIVNRGGEVPVSDLGIKQITPTYCVRPTYALEIFADGQVAYCADDSLLKRPMGNVADSSVMEVWDSPKYKQLRNDLRHNRVVRLPEVCLACRSKK